MDVQELEKHVNDLDYALSMQVLRPEEQILLSAARDRLSGYLESAKKEQAVRSFKSRLWNEAERRTEGTLMGEGILRAPRFEFPKEFSHAGPDVILQNELRRPAQGEIRNVWPNSSFEDPMSIPSPEQPMASPEDTKLIEWYKRRGNLQPGRGQGV